MEEVTPRDIFNKLVENCSKIPLPEMSAYFKQKNTGILPMGVSIRDVKRASRSTTCSVLKGLIGKHKTLGPISVGLSLKYLTDQEKTEYADKNKSIICKRNDPSLLIAFNLAVTGYINLVVSFLSKYSMEKDLSKPEVINLYEKTLKDWDDASFFVRKETQPKTLFKKIEIKMYNDTCPYFVFASHSAINVAKKVFKTKTFQKLALELGYQVDKQRLNSSSKELAWIISKKKEVEK